MLVLKEIGLSKNPAAKSLDDAKGINGKINVTSDGRKYFMAHFADPLNPFAPTRQRMISQQTRANGPEWVGINPTELKAFLGKQVPGELVTKEVKPYTVGEGENARIVNIFTAVVFTHESVETVFKNSQVELLESPEAVSVAAKTAVPAEGNF